MKDKRVYGLLRGARQWAPFFVWLCATLCFVVYAAGTAAYTQWSTYEATSAWLAAAAVAGALGIEVTKPVAASRVMQWHPKAIVALAAVVTTVAASTTIELQATSRARAQYSATTTSGALTKHDAKLELRRKTLTRELEGIEAARPSQELIPLIKASQDASGDCRKIESVTQREACKRLPQLQAEAGRATRSEELRSLVAKVDADSGSTAGATPETVVTARLLALIHVRTTPENVDDLLALAWVVFIQAGGVLSAMLAPPAPRGSETPSRARVSLAQGGAEERDHPLTDEEQRFLVVLRGGFSGSRHGYRTWASTVGLNRKALSGAARSLERRGLVEIDTSQAGTMFTLTEDE